MNTDAEQAQLLPLVALLYCDFSQREIDLLVNLTNADGFPADFKNGVCIEYMQSHVLWLLMTTAELDMHIQSHTATICMCTQKPCF